MKNCPDNHVPTLKTQRQEKFNTPAGLVECFHGIMLQEAST
jgi:hypothetical protein